MRISTACVTCRARRRKCEIPDFGSACTYCTDRGLQCTRDNSGNSRTTSAPVQTQQLQEVIPIETPILPSSVGLPPVALCLELVDLYFDFIHDQFHSLFHRPTLMEEVRTGTAPPANVFAMMALSARFSSNPIFAGINPRDRGNDFAKESNRLLDLRDVSLSTAQACILLGAFSIVCGEALAESVYYCVACRIANLLDVANRPCADAIEREINVRVWRSLCMIDVWSSAGVRLPRSMPNLENMPLPIDEVTFLELKRGDLLPAGFNHTSSAASSLLVQMIKLNRILMDINSLNERTVAGTTSGVILENQVMDLSNALDDWHARIPSFLHDTPANLQHYAAQGLGRMFVAVYLGYYHFGQLLFYQFLQGDGHSTVLSARFYANKCKTYAEKLCEIVYASHSIPNCDVQYTMVGHILVIASTVQIHTLLFSDNEAQIAACRRRLERNFEILSQLRTVWPTLDISFTRLRAFHKACRNSMSESFRLDQWMLRFLSEFANPVDDKIVGESADTAVWSLENIGNSPGT